MLKRILDSTIASVRLRDAQGDCPTEPAFSVEHLEGALLSLALETGYREGSPAALTIDEAWRDLCEKDERLSPADYEDMALITKVELADYMARAGAVSSPAAEGAGGEAFASELREAAGNKHPASYSALIAGAEALEASRLSPDPLADEATGAVPDAVAKAVAAEREACAKLATSFLVGDPAKGVPLRNPMAHEIAERIRARAALADRQASRSSKPDGGGE